jgi:endoglucanase
MLARRLVLVVASLGLACGSGDATTSPASPSPRALTPPDAPPAPSPTPTPPQTAAVPLPAVPLHTDGRYVVDAKGKRFKLASVNWYGAEERDFVVAGLDRADLDAIAKGVRDAGFNSVRLPWSNELVETNPVVDAASLSKNPKLAGKTALEILDAVIDALARQGLVVVLDNHTSSADWCCTEKDGNGLWFTDAYPEIAWLADWRTIARRYAKQPAVVGADLRNELRGMPDGRKPTWGGADPTLDWRSAASRAAEAVLGENPSLLVVVEGLAYANDLTGVYANPLTLSVPNRLVYSAHDYPWDHNGETTYDAFKTHLGNAWGYILAQGKPYTAPVWVGEFGTDHDGAHVSAFWFQSFARYLSEADIDWSYWALNGTEATGAGRTLGAEESFGFLDAAWSAPASKDLAAALAVLAPQHEGP